MRWWRAAVVVEAVGFQYPLVANSGAQPVAPKKKQIPHLSDKDAGELMRLFDNAVGNFKGDIGELQSAIGMMVTGRLFGWRVLVLAHNKRTIRKYEEILGVDIREELPEEGPLVQKSVGYAAALKLGNFWKAVSGTLRVENRKTID